MAKSNLTYHLDDYLYVALIDHLNFAVERHKQGLDFENAMTWEVQRYYKKEFQIALNALQKINNKLQVNLPEDEATSIALHFVNSQMYGQEIGQTIKITEMVNDVLNIVKYYFYINIDEDSVTYERFVTHIRFFAMRLVKDEVTYPPFYDEWLFEQVINKYEKAYDCVKRINNYIFNYYNWEVTHEETMYLVLHVQRLKERAL